MTYAFSSSGTALRYADSCVLCSRFVLWFCVILSSTTRPDSSTLPATDSEMSLHTSGETTI